MRRCSPVPRPVRPPAAGTPPAPGPGELWMCPKERSPSGRPGRLGRPRPGGAVRCVRIGHPSTGRYAARTRRSGPVAGSRIPSAVGLARRGRGKWIPGPVAGSRIPSAVGLARRGRGKWIPGPRAPVKRGGAAADPGTAGSPAGSRDSSGTSLRPRASGSMRRSGRGRRRGGGRCGTRMIGSCGTPSRISSSPSAARDPLEALNHHPLPLPSRYRRELGALPGHLDRYRNL